MKIIFILILIFLVFFILVLFIANKVMHFISTPKLPEDNDVIIDVKNKNEYAIFENVPREDFICTSFDGYQLHCALLKQVKHPTSKYTIITHGFTSAKYYDLKYASIFYDLGYNVVIYDIRHHGDNQRCFVSMGIKESKDLGEMIKYVKQHFDPDAVIGLHGESLGSATSLIALENNQDLAFLVSDCGFSNLKKLLNYLVKHLCHLPRFFVPIVNLLSNMIYHNPYCSIKPVEHLANNQVPILFIHGAADTFIPPYMCQELYDATPGYKEMYLFPNADHALSYPSDPQKYKEVIGSFLQNIGM